MKMEASVSRALTVNLTVSPCMLVMTFPDSSIAKTCPYGMIGGRIHFGSVIETARSSGQPLKESKMDDRIETRPTQYVPSSPRWMLSGKPGDV